MLLVTGGAGFIGANLIDYCLRHTPHHVVVLDALTYAGGLDNLDAWLGSGRLTFEQGDIRQRSRVRQLLQRYQPEAIVHLAAESHVDRSITGADAFVDTNVVGTLHLLQATLGWWDTLPAVQRQRFRLLHVSTDEVFGSLAPGAAPFDEHSPYAPNSPYAASKAAADHLVRAWHRTHGLPAFILHSANNYGPRQYPEKLIPLAIQRALAGQTIPLYGDGQQQRDWLHVSDHCHAIAALLEAGEPGQVYLAGGGAPCSNRELLEQLCGHLDDAHRAGLANPSVRWPDGGASRLLRHVADRPGHDVRYASNTRRLRDATGWAPVVPLADGLRDTVHWYLTHPEWLARRRPAAAPDWMKPCHAHPTP